MTSSNAPLYRGQGLIPEQFVNQRSPYTQFQSWLGETLGVVGCPVDCKYCFFQLDGKTPAKPKEFMNPRELVDQLCKVPTYTKEMPINYGSETDVFSTSQTVAYYSELLRYYGQSQYPNPIVLISKRSIPAEIMDIAAKIHQPVLFYMSLSGLGGTPVEPTVNPEAIKQNFIKLKERNLLAIHYWRPFLPQNSTVHKIEEVLEFVSQNAVCSVINGLRLNSGIREHVAPFWPELMDREFDFTQSGEFWPEGIRQYLIQHIGKRYPMYPVFFGNTSCSVAYALRKSDVYGHYDSSACRESNCPLSQRNLCGSACGVPTLKEIRQAAEKIGISWDSIIIEEGRIILKGTVETGKITYLRHTLKFPVFSESVSYIAGYNWANIRAEERVIEVPWKDNWTSDG